MITANLKALLDKCNTQSTAVLNSAAGLTVNRTHYEVAIEHVLLSCLQAQGTDVPLLLARFGVDAGRLQASLNDCLEGFRAGNSSRPVFSPLLMELLENAWLVASVDLGLSRISTGALLLAFLRKPAAYAQGGYIDLLEPISPDVLRRDYWELTKASIESDNTFNSAKDGQQGSPSGGSEGFTTKFCEDFTAKAKEGQIDPVFGRDQEIRQILDILARRRKNNPILVGEPGVGKTAVIEGLALRIVQADVPEMLRDVTLLGLDLGLLEAGAGMKGEFERRLKGVLDEIKSSEKPIILFIDEAHTLIGAGNSTGSSDAANLLKPALARGEINTCAATTWVEYKRYFEKDPALARRFQLVRLQEPSVETTTLILRGLRGAYEKAHSVTIRDEALTSAAEFSDRFIQGRFLPDKAIDLIDTACARVKINLSSEPATLEDLERSIQALERERSTLERDQNQGASVDAERIQTLSQQITDATERAEGLREAWRLELEAARQVIATREAMSAELEADPGGVAVSEAESLRGAFDRATEAYLSVRTAEGLVATEVTPDIVARVVSDWTGIPVGKMARQQAALVADLNQRLGERIKGQDLAIELIASAIKASRAGLRAPEQPQAVFLLVGPSGVGKTETGLALADRLFGDERSAITINMSEFQEKHTVSRLIGSPPGYVGYGEGGMLTEAVRQRPYSVVLLDEVEKAHLDVMNLFYQVFDKGTLTDAEGKDISFRNTVIMLTSNLASDVIQEMTKEDNEVDQDTLMSTIRPILSAHFKPALLARMEIVPYLSLSEEALKRITQLKLDALSSHLMRNNKMTFSYTDQVIEQIVARCTDVETGARNIQFIIAGTIMPMLSQAILAQMTGSKMPSSVALRVGEENCFLMDFDEAASAGASA
ncbi:MAG: type VI secretion system ATPase TssH [Halochromatium sp.]|nr:type VI secretion system ATPase TssH [Halochromatium sp.]